MASKLDEYAGFITQQTVMGASAAQIAKMLGFGPSTVKDWLREHPEYDHRGGKHDTGTERIDLPNGGAVVAGGASTPEELLAELGMDIAEWNIDHVRVADGPVRWLRVSVTPKVVPEIILPTIQSVEWRRPERTVHRDASDGTVAVVMGDSQCPYHDKVLHELSLQFLRDVQPERGIDVGDLMDMPTLSKFKPDPNYNASPMECRDAAVQVLKDRVEASATEWELLWGNHDDRLRDYVLANAPQLAGLLDIKHLLPLDELGVKLIESGGRYNQAHTKIGKLLVTHGDKTGKNASQASLTSMGHANAFGHTHHKDTLWLTRYDLDGNPETVRVDQIGCMCEIRGGLGYAGPRPDWQQGFVTVTTWPDGFYNIDHATYVDGVLLWRGERWEA
jgi:hypothetical protein